MLIVANYFVFIYNSHFHVHSKYFIAVEIIQAMHKINENFEIIFLLLSCSLQYF